MSCAKTAELIKMQFGMWSQLGPGNMYYMVMQMLPRERHFCGCLADWKALDFAVG